ncbi:MltA domain-containing protein [Asticcacaulis biprosthecium]|nr:MltA domain-containing protein [Asticcacaulis biprosthecium]
MFRKIAIGFTLTAALLVSACVQTPSTPPVVTPPVVEPVPPVTPPVTPVANPVPANKRLDTLPGWVDSDAFIALEALRATCIYKAGRQYAAVCADLKDEEFNTPADIKAFLITRFQVEAVPGEGLLTGYYVPDYQAEYAPTTEFSQPVRPKPDDLVVIPGSQLTPPSTAVKIAARKVGDKYVPYYTRAEIELMPVATSYYMRPEDYFFMQLQGSAFLTTPDGKTVYSAYAADNGRPFVGIAKVMQERGYLAPNQTSGDNIHKWLAEHRGPEATEVMNINPRYGFFVIQPDRTAPVGASGLSLPPGSAIAVDPTLNPLGDLFWIDANAGTLADAFPVYQRMVSALDTGGAIKGQIRADLYVGHGAKAGTEAGRIKHKLKMWRIVPFVGN